MRHFTDILCPSGPLAGTAVSALAALSLISGAGAQESGEVQGYRYLIHSAKPAGDRFDAEPSSFERVTTRYVAQGPQFTAMWMSADEQTLDRASFARGERRMGLFVPYRDLDRPASNPAGWTDFGRPLEYQSFDVEVSRGDDDRTIADRSASHYMLEAEYNVRRAGSQDTPWSNKTVSSDVWIVEDLPFSAAPISGDRAYADPRLQAALAEHLGALGMIVRIETEYARHSVDEDGAVLGHPNEGTHLAWVTDLESAAIAALDIPMASEEQLDALRDASRENREQTCETVMAGQTPDFVSTQLDGEQARVFVEHLAARCAQ